MDITDQFPTYKAAATHVTLGQHERSEGSEEMTSNLFTSMIERAAFNSAFGFEWRVGASGTAL